MEALPTDQDQPPKEVSYSAMSTARSTTSSIGTGSPYMTPGKALPGRSNRERRNVPSSKSTNSANGSDYLGNCPPLPPFSPTRILPPKKSPMVRMQPPPYPPSTPITSPPSPSSGKQEKNDVNVTLIKSLQRQIYTLKQHVEELRSSESVIVGEQKMLIQQLQAVEPQRVKFLAEELNSTKHSFVDMLEEQIENIAEMQLGLNKVRKDSAVCAGVIFEDEVSEIVNYTEEIKTSQKNIAMLRSILDRRTSALVEEVNRLSIVMDIGGKMGGMGVENEGGDNRDSTEIGVVYRVRSQRNTDLDTTPESQIDSPNEMKYTAQNRKIGIDASDIEGMIAEDDVCKGARQNVQRNSIFRDTLEGYLDVDDSFSIGHVASTRSDNTDRDKVVQQNHEEGYGDDSDEGSTSTFEQLEILQKQINSHQRVKEAEIGELRCALALQHKHFSARMIEMQMKIEQFHFQEARRQGINTSRINMLEGDRRMLWQSIDSIQRNDLNASSQANYNSLGTSGDNTVPHDNLCDETFYANITEDSPEGLMETQMSQTNYSEHSSGSVNQQTVETDATSSSRTSGRSLLSEQALISEKDRQIEFLRNELKEAKKVIEHVEATLKTYENNDECQPLIKSCSSSGTLNPKEREELQQEKLSWLKKRIGELKRKRKHKRKKSCDKYNRVDKQVKI